MAAPSRSGKLLTYFQVRRMAADDLEALWDLDFEALIIAAIIDADGRAHPALADTLRSQKWASRWRDALLASEAELSVSVERMDYLNNPRLTATANRLRRVRTRLDEARTRIKDLLKYEGKQNEVQVRMGKASETAKAWLVKHHHEEWARHFTKERTALGLAEAPPTRTLPSAEDGLDAYVLLIEHGYVDLPLSPYGNKLLDADDQTFLDVVADDARTQSNPLQELRHPLLMHDWMAALQDLEEMTREPARADPDGSRGLLPLDRAALKKMPHADAMGLINARRFYQQLIVRFAEWEYLFVRYGRTAAAVVEEIGRPWFEAGRRAGCTVRDAHLDQYLAILTALAPYRFSEVSDTLDQSRFHNQVRRETKRLIMGALADGTWKNLTEQERKEQQT